VSFDAILARSPSIIYQPGGTPSGLIVTKWSAVQKFIAARQGAVTVLVDDSIAPATADVGTTDCESRVTFTSAFQHEKPSTCTLVLPDGAILKDVRRIDGLLTVKTQGTTQPNLQFTNDRVLTCHDGAVIENTGTQPVCRLGAGGFLVIMLCENSTFSNTGAGAGPLVDMPAAGAQAVLYSVTGGGYTGDNVVTGIAGTSAIFQYDASIGAVPTNPGFAGSTTNFALDEAPFVEYAPAVPANWAVPPTQVAQALDELASGSVLILGAIIYQPGGVSSGDTVATWAEVQSFIARAHGKCIVYVDDSIVSPALVPGASGVTECFGRVELRPFKIDAINFSVLEIEDGATLSNLYQVTDLELRMNCQSATKSLSWTGTPNGGFLMLWQFGYLSQATTATQPGIQVAAGQTVLIQCDNGAIIAGQGFNDITVPPVTVAAGGNFQVAAYNNSDVFPNYAEGAGDVLFEYDDSSADFFFPTATPPSLPALTGTYTTERNGLTTIALSVGFAFNTASPLILIPVNTGSIVTRAQIQIATPFNDPAATVLFGTSATPNLIMGAGDSDPAAANTYDKPDMVTIPANDKLQITISPGASTQGTGVLYYEIRTT
jgi:hypothetical protein